MDKVLLRGGHFSGLIVEDVADDTGGFIITAHYTKVVQAVTGKKTQDIIYTDTGRTGNVSEHALGWESARVFEVDFPAMRGKIQYEMQF